MRYTLESEFIGESVGLQWTIVDTRTGTRVATVHVFDGTAQGIVEYLNATDSAACVS